MNPPDFDVEWQVAKRIVAASRLLVDYLAAAPDVSKQLKDQLDHAFDELMQLAVMQGASSYARATANELSNWIAVCMTAVEDPAGLEIEDD